MAGKSSPHIKKSFVTICGLLFSLAVATYFCSNNDKSSQGIDPEVKELLRSLGENFIIPVYEDFKTKAEGLKEKTKSYNDSVSASVINKADESDKLKQAQEAWKKAMKTWQKAEMMQLGPAGTSGKRIGGKNLRDEVYSWPTSNPCKVDTEIVENQFGSKNFFSDNRVNAYGLDAIEYLLFHTGTSSSCPDTATIITNNKWKSFSDKERTKRRAAYAASAAAEVARRAGELLGIWKTGETNFLEQFTNAGSGKSVYESQKAALNEILGAMFYLDLVVKDQKLARPLGLTSDCSSACPDSLESRYANYSKEEIIENLRSFQEFFQGGQGRQNGQKNSNDNKGFDDLLQSMGESNLVNDLTENIKAAIAKAEGINGSLKDLLNGNSSSVRSLHGDIKKITNQLKGDMVTVLKLQIPQDAAGDSD